MMKNTCKWWTNVHTFIFVSFSCHSIKSILSRQRFLIISIIYRSAFPSYPYIFGQSSIFLGPSILNQLIYQNLTYLWVTNLYLVPPQNPWAYTLKPYIRNSNIYRSKLLSFHHLSVLPMSFLLLLASSPWPRALIWPYRSKSSDSRTLPKPPFPIKRTPVINTIFSLDIHCLSVGVNQSKYLYLIRIDHDILHLAPSMLACKIQSRAEYACLFLYTLLSVRGPMLSSFFFSFSLRLRVILSQL